MQKRVRRRSVAAHELSEWAETQEWMTESLDPEAGRHPRPAEGAEPVSGGAQPTARAPPSSAWSPETYAPSAAWSSGAGSKGAAEQVPFDLVSIIASRASLVECKLNGRLDPGPKKKLIEAAKSCGALAVLAKPGKLVTIEYVQLSSADDNGRMTCLRWIFVCRFGRLCADVEVDPDTPLPLGAGAASGVRVRGRGASTTASSNTPRSTSRRLFAHLATSTDQNGSG